MSARLPITTAYLRSVLRWQRTGSLAVRAGPLDRESERALQALGYL